MMSKDVDLSDPLQHASGPVITGNSVIALKYKDGIIMAADTVLKYAGCQWYKGINRINKISDNTLLGSTGDYSDLQQILKQLKDKHDLDAIAEDGFEFLGPKDYHKWLANLQFNKRMRVDPLWANHVVAGIDASGNKFLGTVDLYGNNYEADFICAGIANYFCKRILTEGMTDDLSRDDAIKLLKECFTVLFYRDKFQSDNIQIVSAFCITFVKYF